MFNVWEIDALATILFVIFSIPIIVLASLVYTYKKYNLLNWRVLFNIFGFFSSFAVLIIFTIFPIPEPGTLVCEGSNVLILNPFASLADIVSGGLRIGPLLQVVFNILLFVPFGYFVKKQFNPKLITIFVLGLFTSLFIEATQYSAIYGIYPCSYRVADSLDVILNTSGVIVGYFLALKIFNKTRNKKTESIATKRASAFFIDAIIIALIQIIVSIVYVQFNEVEGHIYNYILTTTTVVLVAFVYPLLNNHQTYGQKVTGLNFRTKNKSKELTTFIRFLSVWIGFILTPTTLLCWVPVIANGITLLVRKDNKSISDIISKSTVLIDKK
jgi:glycopeptide antibiotics resistance protein